MNQAIIKNIYVHGYSSKGTSYSKESTNHIILRSKLAPTLSIIIEGTDEDVLPIYDITKAAFEKTYEIEIREIKNEIVNK